MKEKAKTWSRFSAIIAFMLILHPGFFAISSPTNAAEINNILLSTANKTGIATAHTANPGQAILLNLPQQANPESLNLVSSLQPAPNLFQQDQNVIQNPLQLNPAAASDYSEISLVSANNKEQLSLKSVADQRTILVQITEPAPRSANLLSLQYSGWQAPDRNAIASGFGFNFTVDKTEALFSGSTAQINRDSKQNQFASEQNNPENLSIWRC